MGKKKKKKQQFLVIKNLLVGRELLSIPAHK